jgi:hypothetical protein
MISRVAVGTGAVVVGTVVSLLRQGGPGALNTVWAEDGQIFLTEAVGKDLGALTTSYAGYFHAIPRLLAAPIALLPADWAGVALATSAALVTALFALVVFQLSAEFLPGRLSRAIVALPVVAVPLSQNDVPNSIANLHWLGLYVLFWLLLCRPVSWLGQALAVAGIVLIVDSDILAGTYLPFVGFLIWFHRDRYTIVKGAAFVVALAFQVGGLLFGASQREGLEPNPIRWLTGYILRAVPSALFGQRFAGTTVTKTTLVFAALAWLIVGAALVLALRRYTSPKRLLAALAGFHSVALYAAPVALSGVATSRYAVAPAMLLLVALVALLNPRDAKSGPLWALAGLMAVVVVVNLRVDNPRAAGPAWDAELREARVACATGGAVVAVPIPPQEPPWYATLPCDYIRAN